MTDFRFRIVDEMYVVWIAGINRYLQLQEPAFRVFERWAADMQKTDIAKVCTEMYDLPEKESIRFVDEITGQVQDLFNKSGTKPSSDSKEAFGAGDQEFLSEHTYQIGNQFFRFIYRDQYLKDLVHPLFSHQETKSHLTNCTVFELWNTGNKDALLVNNTVSYEFSIEEIENFQGAVYMEILNALHGKVSSDWMGVLHASAVTDGGGAVLFTAPSGSGKSSIALLMMAEGFNILSDDFVPVAIKNPEIYHFPAGISVKKSAGHFLQEFISQPNIAILLANNETEVYLPTGENGLLCNVPAKAIVFVKYDPETEYELKRESNLQVMNLLIEQSWIAGTPEAAEAFLSWYFTLPVYTLRYSDNQKAVEGISGLFK